MSKTILLLACLVACAPMAVGQAVPTFVGVRTFLGAPYHSDLDDLSADFAVLGVPFDEGTWGWPGERYGPRGMRESSQEYNHDLTEGFYYIDGDRAVLKGKHWVDVGDVPVMPTVPSQTEENVVHKIRAKGSFQLSGEIQHHLSILRAVDVPVPSSTDAHLTPGMARPGTSIRLLGEPRRNTTECKGNSAWAAWPGQRSGSHGKCAQGPHHHHHRGTNSSQRR